MSFNNNCCCCCVITNVIVHSRVAPYSSVHHFKKVFCFCCLNTDIISLLDIIYRKNAASTGQMRTAQRSLTAIWASWLWRPLRREILKPTSSENLLWSLKKLRSVRKRILFLDSILQLKLVCCALWCLMVVKKWVHGIGYKKTGSSIGSHLIICQIVTIINEIIWKIFDHASGE